MAVVAIVSGVVSIAGSLLNKKDATGLPRIPSNDPAFNLALATKWYTLYFTRYAPGGPNANAATQASGIAYWAEQIKEDGPDRAWANFSTSAQPVADGVAAKAAQLATQYGKYDEVIAPVPSATVPPIQGGAAGTLTTGAPAPALVGGPAQVAGQPVTAAPATLTGFFQSTAGIVTLVVVVGAALYFFAKKR